VNNFFGESQGHKAWEHVGAHEEFGDKEGTNMFIRAQLVQKRMHERRGLCELGNYQFLQVPSYVRL